MCANYCTPSRPLKCDNNSRAVDNEENKGCTHFVNNVKNRLFILEQYLRAPVYTGVNCRQEAQTAEICSHIILCAFILTKQFTSGKGLPNIQRKISCAGYNNDFYKISGVAVKVVILR